jgi:hypothetical protein
VRFVQVHYPAVEIGASLLLRPFVPETLDRIVRVVRKRVFLRCHFMLNTIILPRQARDKHWASTQKETRFITGDGPTSCGAAARGRS